uniref:Uncharacterized protein n=1 Tax=Rhizophora mucronata TaxID=61149 RepID=A0A2P2PGD6_RHIMU
MTFVGLSVCKSMTIYGILDFHIPSICFFLFSGFKTRLCCLRICLFS